MQLNDYLKQVQRFLREGRQGLINPQDLIDYVNRARREVAERTQCLRIVTPISGSVETASVTGGGSGYTNPTVTITAPDFPSGTLPSPGGAQATASATEIGGVIQSVNINFGGYGYFQPQATISDPHGSGAVVTLQVSAINVLQPNQEQYPLANINVSTFPGIAAVYNVHTVSILYANYRYNLPKYSFPVYQGFIRTYPFQYNYVPCFFSQTGRGTSGILYLYPWPSQAYQAEFYCACIPQDLTTPNSVDVIPSPWDDTVPYFAAHLAYMEMQNFNAGMAYLNLFDKMVQRKSDYDSPGRVTNIYGRW